MKGLIWTLVLTSQLVFAQNNISFLHNGRAVISYENKAEDAVMIAPFELVNGMIIVQASLDGQLGNFILDTGAPSVVLNSNQVHAGERVEASGITGGHLEVAELQISQFEWGLIRQDGMTGFALDMGHLEAACGRDLMGLIGFSVIHDFELFFDYPNRTIRIINGSHQQNFRADEPLATIPFKLDGHLPVIAAKIGDHKVNLGLDSGASTNLLDKSFFELLNNHHLQEIESEYVVGLDQVKHTVLAANVAVTSLKDTELVAMRYLFLDLGPVRTQVEGKIDGLLGFPFFQNHTVSINYEKQKIYIWK